MNIVETPWERTYKFILFIFGIPFFLIGVIFRSSPLIINGIIWAVLGMGLLIKNIYNKRKLETLKRDGFSYEASVVKIFPAHMVKIGSYLTARVECLYKTEKGDSVVISGYHLLSPLDRIEDLQAKIYIDRNDSNKYAVELFRNDTIVAL